MKHQNQATVSSDATIRYIGRIPVRNIWLLMLYASDLFRQLGPAKIEVEKNLDEIPDLVAEILAAAVERRLKRNLSYGYRSRNAVLNRVRGRIDLFSTERHQLLYRGQVACHFDELTVNTPRNCYVRSALDSVARVVHRSELARRCRILASTMKRIGVVGPLPSRRKLSTDRLGSHNQADQHLMAAAQLAFELALPTEVIGSRYLTAPEREIKWIRKLFEKGVAGFYKVVIPEFGWSVHAGKRLDWIISDKTNLIDQILPGMVSDIELINKQEMKRIVIDTKFNSLLNRGWYRDEVVKSQYIYQIYTYLRSQEDGINPATESAVGVLLHPTVDGNIDESVTIQGHKIRFKTVDLTLTAVEIRNQLLQIIEMDLL